MVVKPNTFIDCLATNCSLDCTHLITDMWLHYLDKGFNFSSQAIKSMNFKVVNNIKDFIILKSTDIMDFIIRLKAINIMDFIVNLMATNIMGLINLMANSIVGFASIQHSAKNKVFNQLVFSSITTLKYQASNINLGINFHTVAANSIFTLAFQVIIGKGCTKGSCLGSCLDFNLVA